MIFTIICPALMVLGATGSAITNIALHGDKVVTFQWLMAAGLYTALLFRNIG